MRQMSLEEADTFLWTVAMLCTTVLLVFAMLAGRACNDSVERRIEACYAAGRQDCQ